MTSRTILLHLTNWACKQVQQGKVNAALKDLQDQLTAKDTTLQQQQSEANTVKMQLDRLKNREATLVSELDASLKEIKMLRDVSKELEAKYNEIKVQSVPGKVFALILG